MCEMGVLYGWKYMADMIMHEVHDYIHDNFKGNNKWPPQLGELTIEQKAQLFDFIEKRLVEQYYKKNYAHYFDIRTNHLNEKDWRRSFSINQMLYGMILYATADGMLHNSFDEILPLLQKEYGKKDTNEPVSDWR